MAAEPNVLNVTLNISFFYFQEFFAAYNSRAHSMLL